MTASTDVAAPPGHGSRWALGGRWFSFPLRAYGVVAVGLYTLVGLSRFLPHDPGYAAVNGPGLSVYGRASFRGAALLEGWYRFDGNWYHLILAEGYRYFGTDQQSSVAFFPGYPTVVRPVAWLVGDEVLAGIIVTFLAGLAAALLFSRLVAEKLGEEPARWGVMAFLLYPYAWYLFGAVYADALFVAAVLAAFLLLEHDHPVWAGLAGALATATRPVGTAVVIGLVAVTLERRGVLRLGPIDRWRASPPEAARSEGSWIDLRRLHRADAGILLSLGGLGLWCLYLWRSFGDPLLFAKIQGAPGWAQTPGPTTWFKHEYFRLMADLPGNVTDWWNGITWYPGYDPGTRALYAIGITFQALLVLGALALVPLVLKRLGWGYALYLAAVVGIPLIGSKDFQGTGRYLLAAFPAFAVVGAALADRPRARVPVLAASAVLLALWCSFYARAYYVA